MKSIGAAGHRPKAANRRRSVHVAWPRSEWWVAGLFIKFIFDKDAYQCRAMRSFQRETISLG